MAVRKKSAGSEPISLSGVTVTNVTEKAVLIEWKEKDEMFEAWVPRSVCHAGAFLDKGDTDVSVAGWFVEQEGLPT